MLSRDCRPKTFGEMAGQNLNKEILKKIIEDPKGKPRVLIMEGAFGSGKTTSARIFATALNCTGHNKPCGKCSVCREDIENTPFYVEYDSSVVGTVDKIRDLRDTFYYAPSNGYKVIVFDEAHLASKTAQSALLKVLEDSPDRIFYIFATTEVEKVLPTIRSRGMELTYSVIPREKVVDNLRKICTLKVIEASDEILEVIARKSKGHMRNAHMLLDKFRLIGEEKFKEELNSSRDSWIKYFTAIVKKSTEMLFESISELITFPLAEIKDDYQELLLDLAKGMVGVEVSQELNQIISIAGVNVLKIVKLGISEWVVNSFSSDIEFQTGLLCMYDMLVQMLNTSAKPVQRQNSAARR